MLQEKIEDTFTKYPDLRILFYFDPDGKNESETDQMQLSGIRIMKYSDNPLKTKIQLNDPDLNERILLYLKEKSPSSQEEYHSFPILDLLIANRELRLDDVAGFIDEYRLQPHHESLVRKYMRELKYLKVRETLAEILNPTSFNEDNIIQGLVASFLDYNRFMPWEHLIARIMSLAMPDKQDLHSRFLKKLAENNLSEYVIRQLKMRTGHQHDSLSKDSINDLVIRVKYNIMTLGILNARHEDIYRHLKITEPALLSRIKLFHETCLADSGIGSVYLNTIEICGSAVREKNLAEVYALESDFSWYNRDLYLESLRQWMQLQVDKPGLCMESFSRLLEWADDEDLKDLTLFLVRTSEVIHRIAETGSMVYDKPEKYIDQYVTNLYKIDRAYRKAVLYYNRLDETHIGDLDVRALKENLENDYFRFSDLLNRNWTGILKDKETSFYDLEVPRQYDFYKEYIEGSNQKVAVVISDGLRFEAGTELLSVLHEDPKNEAEVRYMVTSLPSKTELGMANLLPADTMQYKNNQVIVDGFSSAGVKEREALLKRKNESSRAVGYNNLISLNKNEIRDIFKSSVVYVYHNTIDAIGDDRKTENKTFNATEEAIGELKKFINQVHHTYNVTRVIVTADHGYLYNDRIISEMDKESFTASENDETHPRFVIMKKETSALEGYFISLREVSRLEDDRFIMVPSGINRYRVQGAGQQYVHGGASLQEIVVPVIISTRRRVAVAEKVDPVLKQKDLRIVSNMLRIQLIQKEPVSGNKKERHLVVGLYHGNQLASNQAEMVMASTSDLPTERMYPVDLVLRSDAGDHDILTLKIFDKDDTLNPLEEVKVINTTIIKRDF